MDCWFLRSCDFLFLEVYIGVTSVQSILHGTEDGRRQTILQENHESGGTQSEDLKLSPCRLHWGRGHSPLSLLPTLLVHPLGMEKAEGTLKRENKNLYREKSPAGSLCYTDAVYFVYQNSAHPGAKGMGNVVFILNEHATKVR